MAGKGGRRVTTWGQGWNCGETKVIRIPAALESKVMEYARALDCGQIPISASETQTAILLAVDQFVADRLRNFHPNQYSRSGTTNTRRWDELRRFGSAIALESSAQSHPVSARR